ncbi:Pyroglutamylated RF-amide peptide receptor [Acropora cervicornis]|uniref:Pyroglutamylated RF-amide peptide receptor n=1 Tax=Acropora cervicornis TaxID=6130 RepID=A0AAD9VB60_ACRCE|nr:Pyroglutamylated RF-amide peptide receptor [Acropora cervicornis]
MEFKNHTNPLPTSIMNSEYGSSERTLPGGLTLLIFRSYNEKKLAFAISLSISAILITLGIIVNVAICFVMLRKKRYLRNCSNFFIMHLSGMELVYRFLVFPILIRLTAPSSAITNNQCKTTAIFYYAFASAIFPSLLIIAVDRYHSIIHPLETLKLKRKRFWLACFVWLFAVIASCPFGACVETASVLEIPEARGIPFDDTCQKTRLCNIPQSSFGQAVTTLYFLLAFAFPLIAILVLYTKVVIFLNQRSRNGAINKTAVRSKVKAVRMLFISVTSYILSLGPGVVLPMVRSYGIFNNFSFDVILLVSWSAEFASYTSSLGNPLIYGYYNGDFRKEVLRLFHKGKNKTGYKGALVNFRVKR